MSWAAIIVGVVGAGAGVVGAREQARGVRRAGQEAQALSLTQINLRDRAADTLDNLAQNILSGKAITQDERRVINMAQQVASGQIERARQTAQKNVLAAQAATGFLKGGRTARQLRRLNIEAGESQQRIALAREQAIQQAVERRQQTAIGALQANLGLQPQLPPQVSQGLPSASILGAGLTGISGALFQGSAQQQAQQQQQQFIQSLFERQQGAAGTTGTTGTAALLEQRG